MENSSENADEDRFIEDMVETIIATYWEPDDDRFIAKIDGALIRQFPNATGGEVCRALDAARCKLLLNGDIRRADNVQTLRALFADVS
jgi:hypothetical protein